MIIVFILIIYYDLRIIIYVNIIDDRDAWVLPILGVLFWLGLE